MLSMSIVIIINITITKIDIPANIINYYILMIMKGASCLLLLLLFCLLSFPIILLLLFYHIFDTLMIMAWVSHPPLI